MFEVFATRGRKQDFETIARASDWAGLPSGKPIPLKLPHGAQICTIGLMLPDELDPDQWQAVGIKLCTISKLLQWAIGDWWAYGHHTYGKRAAFAKIKEVPYELGSLMNLGSVARRVTVSCRNEVLSFTHHVVVAAFDREEQVHWLAKAAAGKWSVSKLREMIELRRQRALFDVPGFKDPGEPTKWLRRFVVRAERAEQACTFPHSLEPMYLDGVTESAIDELIDASMKAAAAWSAVAAELEKYRQTRASKEPQRSESGRAKSSARSMRSRKAPNAREASVSRVKGEPARIRA